MPLAVKVISLNLEHISSALNTVFSCLFSLLLTALTFFVGTGVVGGIVGTIFNVIPVVGPYLNLVFLAAWNPLVNTFGIALGLWLYFDIRKEVETGDALAEAAQRLP